MGVDLFPTVVAELNATPTSGTAPLTVGFSMTLANNTERELGYAMPAVLPAGLYFLRLFVQEARLPVVPVLAVTVFMQVLFFLEQRYMEIGMSMYQPTSLRLASAMAVFWIAAQVILRKRQAPAAAPQ